MSTPVSEAKGGEEPQQALKDSGTTEGPHLDVVMTIPVSVQVVLGTTTMPVSHLMKLGRGAVVSLDRKVGEPVDVVVNGRTVAKGEVVVVEEDGSRFGVSLTEIASADRKGEV